MGERDGDVGWWRHAGGVATHPTRESCVRSTRTRPTWSYRSAKVELLRRTFLYQVLRRARAHTPCRARSGTGRPGGAAK
eukprot:440145-Prymnesium_polylepis.1